jgi:hypothetical protein
VQGVDQSLHPVVGLGGVEDFVPFQRDAADDRGRNGIARRLRSGQGGDEEERDCEGEAAGQKRLRELDRM